MVPIRTVRRPRTACITPLHKYCVSMDSHDDPRLAHLDSASLRVLAHPLRTRLLAALRLYGPATSTGLAKRLDTNTGATSYHLRKLEAVGLVTEDADRGTGRERWWKSPHEGTSWVTTEFLDDPGDRAAADWLIGTYAQMNARWHNDWLEARHQWSRAWQDAAGDSSSELFLNTEQLSALNRELHEVINRYSQGGREANAERVKVLLYSFPAPEPRL